MRGPHGARLIEQQQALDVSHGCGWSAREGSDRVAKPSWRSEGSPHVLRGEVKAGCLDEARGACGEPSGRHLSNIESISQAS